MIELLLLITGIVAMIYFRGSIGNIAKTARLQVESWGMGVKKQAIENIAKTEISEETVTKANTNIQNIKKIKLD